MNRQEIDRICYSILLSIGDTLDLRKMLGRSLALYMGELSCRMGAVLLVDGKDSQSFNLSVAYSIPRNISQQASFKALMQEILHNDIRNDIITRKMEGSPGTFYIMSVSDMGLLILYKHEGEIDGELLQALLPLNQKLGNACKACVQNTELQKNNQQFMEMANMLPGLIVELDQDYRVTFFNRRTQEIFKQIDSDEFHPKRIFDFFPAAEIPRVRDLLNQCESGETMTSGDFWMKNSRNELFMVNLIISPISYYNTITGFRGIAIDISKRVKLENDLQLRDRLLNAIALSTQELLKSNEFTQAIPTSLELLGKATGVDRVYYFMNTFDDHGNVHLVSQRAEWSADYVEPQIDNPDLQNVPAEYIGLFLEPLLERKPFIAFVKDLPPCLTKDLLAEQNILSILVLPIFSKNALWGFVGFDDCTTERVWSDIERDLLDLFAISISEAIERKQAEDEIKALYRDIMDDLEIAQTIQKSILPPWFQIQGDLLLSANYLPWSKIGGDLFDCIQLSNSRYVIYVADISGHGIQAALTMTAVKAIFSMVIRNEQDNPDPAVVVTILNGLLSKRFFIDNYMTMNYCLLDLENMTLTSLNAGHPPLLILHTNTGKNRLLDQKGDIPLGWIADHVYDSSCIQMEAISHDDTICMLTDGVFESFNKNNEVFGLENLQETLSTHNRLQNCIMLPHLCYELIEKAGYSNRNDDFTFIAFQILQPKETTKIFHIEVQSQLDKVDEATLAGEKFILQAGGSDMEALKCRLIANEFLNNIVSHGLGENTSEIISMEITYKVDNQDIVLTFRDNAGAWDVPEKESKMIDFFDDLNSESMTHGRGMQIIHSFSKSFTRTRNHRINETSFIIIED
jgi:PAS domain S-box-containing protein